MDQNSVAVKIGFNGDLHRLRVDLNTFTLDELTRLFVHTFRLTPGSFVIKYTDAEGDNLNVCSDAEFVEACRVLLGGQHGDLKTLKFTAVSRGDGAVRPENVADPLIQAVERLVHTLNVTVEKARTEEWKGMEVATEALSQAATDAKETLEAARQAVQEKPFEQVVGETSEGLKSAAGGISSFAQRLVTKFIPEKKQAAAAATPPPAPVETTVEEPQEVVQPEEKVEAVVDNDAPEPEVVVPAPAATEAPVAFSEAEIKWAEQLMIVRGIFPDIETARAVEMLERSQGDVNLVINLLMEQVV
ncbi:hypothetical protein Poli38472_013319 [Pythium oligandrum]|uniref:PB1 domain-containing protein n=1 Tax=Pythium oligandrum TaxID=41045 RepID=A0A8K1C7R2_PYTOL|nr:hypothetical protein Poli38472_013319 [Pythium oligandrum]|eukprot:TMW57845.1 hypothetical protein Poli38472_013319 [Pythium oligandrum]